MNVFMMNLGEGIGFFFGCWIGIGSSYVSAFNLAATCTMIIVVIELAVYNLDCDKKRDDDEKIKDDDEVRSPMIKRDMDENTNSSVKAN